MMYFTLAENAIAFFVWLKYKKGQPQGLAPTNDVFHAKGKRYSNSHFG